MKLLGNYKSGNVYKVSLALHLLQKDYQEVQVGLGPDSESTSPEYLSINPLGQIPVLETEDGQPLAQSNAILWYLAQGSDLLPTDGFLQAKVMQWLCFEQYELEPNLAWSRWICYLKKAPKQYAEELRKYHAGGYRALSFVEQQLTLTPFICGAQITIADISLFAYTHCCDQGGLSLDAYPALQLWVESIKELPHFLPMSEQFAQFDYE